ncbi:hypothetical protein E2C01_047990 [Portunus trituberculatus]|uniref:Uncharacterized protein n=1 Tax=Portunus trituberculatus TaxID=210409 RepID=A0A5B7GA06_PORTR|nr:hypothetical protein [Portunus trituberculatus]
MSYWGVFRSNPSDVTANTCPLRIWLLDLDPTDLPSLPAPNILLTARRITVINWLSSGSNNRVAHGYRNPSRSLDKYLMAGGIRPPFEIRSFTDPAWIRLSVVMCHAVRIIHL